ncbi:TPA: hypothetical protein ACGEYH_003792 [Providencia rettgeri]
MRQLKLSINKIISTIMYILLITTLPYSSIIYANDNEIFKIIRHSDGSATIEMGADFEIYASLAQPPNLTFEGCQLNDTVSLIAGDKSGGWSIVDAAGTSDGNCFTPLRPKFPIKLDAGSIPLLFLKSKGVCVGRGKIAQVEWKHIDFCVTGDSIVEVPGDAICKITPIEIVHDYGLVSTSEINGKSITTDATITCTHEKITTGNISVSLEFQNLVDDKLYLRDDKSIYSTLDLDDKGPSENIKVPINQSINVKVKSILSANDNVIGGDFSGNTLLVMTYN